MTSSQGSIAPTRRRELWVDNLRVVVIAGVIVAHAATGYVLGFADWYYDDERNASGLWSTVLTIPGVLGMLFWLGPLFLLAGRFSVSSLNKAGPGAFARRRLFRLGVPLVVYVLLLQPLTDYLGNYRDEGRSFGYYLATTNLGPVWFVAALLAFSLAYAALRALRPPAQSPRPPRRGALVVAAVTIAVTSYAVWQFWPLLSGAGFNLRLSEWPQGAVLFALGVRAAEAGWDGVLTRVQARPLGWAALAGMVVLVALIELEISRGQEESLAASAGWPTMVAAALDGLIAVTWTLWFVSWFHDRWRGHGPLMTEAARASYATYLLHPLVLTTVMLMFAPVALGPWLKFLLVSTFAVPACFTVGYALTRVPVVSKVV